MTKIFPYLILILVAFSSCVSNTDLSLGFKERTVVYSVLLEGSEPQIFFYKSEPFEISISNKPIRFIDNAEVYLIFNGEKVPLSLEKKYQKSVFFGFFEPEDLITDSILVSYYTAPIRILPNVRYQLEAIINGETITAETTVPATPEVTETSIVTEIQTDDEGLKYNVDYLQIKFNDIIGKENFYKYRVFYNQELIIEQKDSNGVFLGFDTIKVGYNYLRGRFISDDNDDGEVFTIKFMLNNRVNTYGDSTYVFSLMSNVISYDPSLIRFNSSLSNQQQDDGGVLDPFKEPVLVKSNINGGLGIFTSRTESIIVTTAYKPTF